MQVQVQVHHLTYKKYLSTSTLKPSQVQVQIHNLIYIQEVLKYNASTCKDTTKVQYKYKYVHLTVEVMLCVVKPSL